MLFRFVVAVILCCGSIARAQEPDMDELRRSEFGGLTQKEISKRIFSKEQDMISRLAAMPFVTETYMQSLGHHQAKGRDLALGEEADSVIDDFYALAKVEFGREYGDRPVEKVLLGEHPWRRHYIKKNTGAMERIFPAGMLSMLFVDLYGFDADRYSLMYRGNDNLVGTQCFVFTVVPVRERDSGRFSGEIWVDSSSYSIVRAKGVFTGPYQRWHSGSGKYFHFDSWRERLGAGWWFPNVTYFNERRAFRIDGNLEFHYRGYAVLWQQHDPPADMTQSNIRNDVTQKATVRDDRFQSGLVARLEADGLLATPGPEEQRLNRIVQQIASMSRGKLREIDCRVLLTTPLDLFAVGDVIVVSRGLLNIVPDESVLAVMLAHQMAHIVLGHTRSAESFPQSLFDRQGERHDLGGFGHWKPEEEVAADSETAVLLAGSAYENAVANTSAFLSGLRSQSHRFPSLAQPRFGSGVIPEGSRPASKEEIATGGLRFENRFRVSSNRTIIDSEEEPKNAYSRRVNKPVAINTFEQK